MADALASGASARKGVGVQVPSRARFVGLLSPTSEISHRFLIPKASEITEARCDTSTLGIEALTPSDEDMFSRKTKRFDGGYS